MQLKVLGSNSQGNCYILENDHEALLIECGVNFKEIKAGIDFNLSKIKGCIVTHEHKDHCKSVEDVLNAGIDVIATLGTCQAMDIVDHHRCKHIMTGREYLVGGFKMIAFATKHDAKEPCGYLINHAETGNVLFLTDTYYSEFTFRNLSQIIVEANYCQNIIDDKIRNGHGQQFLRDRILSSHMSLATCKDLLKANDLSQVRNIVLIHLSDSNSDEVRFQKEVAATTRKQVYIARKGMIIENFNKEPF